MNDINNTPSDLGPQHSPLPEGCPQDGVLKETLQKDIIINGTTLKPVSITRLPYQPRLKERAKALRQAGNLPEVLFWMQVTKKQFHKIDFDRQRIIGNYIVDFYIKHLGLVIEIDGSSHDDKQVYDKRREAYLTSLGLKIYRITVDDVMKQMNFVMMGLEEYIIKEYGTQLS
ncbi:endonuclease domain-containing protein [Pedobacter suwonensis]|uniref:endonuclease domain-containing protein n=1 Tax=Pedobacter suwonensis TaxID=332999 RepID=UPI0011A7D6CD|nr:endonuclease domain-containing protein [Pedobacter suwonensis]